MALMLSQVAKKNDLEVDVVLPAFLKAFSQSIQYVCAAYTILWHSYLDYHRDKVSVHSVSVHMHNNI